MAFWESAHLALHTGEALQYNVCMQVPCMREYQGAILIADITGFTALTEDLGRRGTAGVELLTRCMNNFFTLVIQTVRLPSSKPSPPYMC
jgi:class 3 adenylate cyclase